ncbi:MAG: hypothetical protein ACI865_002201 [Flavobacteriaceae bacterium]
MNNLFDALERYKFGLLAVMGILMAVFIYLKMDSFEMDFEISAYHQGAKVEIPENEIMLRPENIMLPPDFKPEDVKNLSRNANDQRERSYDDYYENSASPQSIADAEKAVRDFEEKIREETGGREAREAIRAELELRKERLKKAQESATTPTNTQETGDVAYEGSVMVDFSVPQHTAHQNNNWYVRNPGYTCPTGSSGAVMILVKVAQSGSVISASYDASQSSGANSCMIEQAKKYAMKSRFNYDSASPSSQSGWIRYTFVSQ